MQALPRPTATTELHLLLFT